MGESFDLIVIGSGPGGYVAAIRAAQLGLKTACIEKNKLGGTCLNIGCIPSKALLHATESYWKLKTEGASLGITTEKLLFNFDQTRDRKEKIVANFNQGIAALFKKNKITSFSGEAHLVDPHRVAVNGEEIEGRSIILATGSEPTPLSFMPFDEERILSSTGALQLKEPPKKMAIIGAGVIGVELGSVYSRLGSEVIFIEFMDRVCSTFDEALSNALQKALTAQGMTFFTSSKLIGIEKKEKLILKIEGKADVTADKLLVSIGRRPYTQGLGLQEVGILPNAQGFLSIDGAFRTHLPHIYAIGDIVDGPMLAHKASEEGMLVAEIIAGHLPHLNYLAIPNVVYTSPEMASVGLSEAEAKKGGLEVISAQFSFKANSRAKCTGEEEGFVKIVAEEKSDRLIGIHIIGAHASELIAQGALAMQKKLTVADLIATPFAHPTLSEAIKEAALSLQKRAIHK